MQLAPSCRPWRPGRRSPWSPRPRRTARRARRDARFWTAATAASGCVDELLGLLVGAGEREVHDDRAAVLGDGVDAVGASSGLSISVTPSIRSRRLTTSRTAAVTAGSPDALALHEHLLAGLLGEARGLDDHVAALGLAAARRRLVELFWPILPPTTVARTTNRIQPRMAVLRCWALHRPARAARLRGCIQGPVLLRGGAGRTAAASQAPRPVAAGGSQASDADGGTRRARGGRTARGCWPRGRCSAAMGSRASAARLRRRRRQRERQRLAVRARAQRRRWRRCAA